MAWRVFLSKLRGLFLAERGFDEELEGHLNLLTERYMRQGMAPEEARYAARRQFGGITKMKEERRENLGIAQADVLWQDTRHALRGLRKNPVFAFVAVFLLAVGLCAAVAIFGFVDAALIKPLPYRDQSRLVGVFETDATSSRSFVSYLDYVDWKNFNNVFSSIEAFAENGSFTLTNRAGAQQVPGTRVSNGFFRTLGVTPTLGRNFRTGENFSVVLSYAAWQKRFGGRQDVLGEVITLNSVPNIIVGVLPRDFHFAPYAAAEFWGTLHATDICERNRGCHNLGIIARLKDGISVPAALAGIKSVARQLEKQHPDSNSEESANVVPLSEVIVGDVRPILLVLLGGAGLLLLIACINVTSLLLARSDGRKREMAVRNALGASSARLFRQFATEALVLVTIGSLFGLISAEWVMQLLTRVMPANMLESMPYLRGLGLNFRVVVFACAVSVMAAGLFATIPALRVSLREMLEGLKEGSRGSAGTMWRRFGANLVVVEVAIAMVLMVGAGLLGQSLYRLLHVDTGLQPDHLATLGLGWTSFSGYSKDEQLVALEREVVRRISALPGVKSVGIAMTLPVGSGWGTTFFRVVGRPYHGEHSEAFRRPVSSAYFTTLQARLLRGRYFSETEDASKPRVVIINQTLAKQFFPGQDPVGKQITNDGQPQSAMQIVGVVDDIKEGPLDTAAGAAVYVPFNQSPVGGFAIAVRTSQAEQSLLPALTAIIHRIDPAISVEGAGTMTEGINRSPTASLHRFSAWLVGSFAAIAFVLGVVGLYGVVAYSVSQRTREIGVRMALGARPTSVYQLILQEAARLAGMGIAVGIACSLAAATLMRGMLFGVHSWDVPTLGAVAVVLGMSALLASYIPARRAASVNPLEALRAE